MTGRKVITVIKSCQAPAFLVCARKMSVDRCQRLDQIRKGHRPRAALPAPLDGLVQGSLHAGGQESRSRAGRCRTGRQSGATRGGLACPAHRPARRERQEHAAGKDQVVFTQFNGLGGNRRKVGIGCVSGMLEMIQKDTDGGSVRLAKTTLDGRYLVRPWGLS